MQIVFCGSGWLSLIDLLRARLGPAVAIRGRDPERSLAADIADADVVLPSNAALDARAIAGATLLRLIQQPAVGTENIDLEAARARGVPVCNAPGRNGEAVAEASLLLMLALARRLPVAARAFASATIGAPIGRELCGRTLGIVGRGASGSHLAQVAQGLGMTVRSVGSASTPGEWDTLWARSDVISLHCPLTPATRGLVGAATLARMKPGAFLINCARGPIVDRSAVLAALSSGTLGGLGLDTYWQEPWDPSDPLFARDDVVTMPHTAGSTEESFSRIVDLVCDNLHRLQTGEPLLCRVA